MIIHKVKNATLVIAVLALSLAMFWPGSRVNALGLNPPSAPIAVGSAILQYTRSVSSPHLTIPGTFVITDTVTNTGSSTADKTTIRQDLPGGFTVSGESSILIELGEIAPGASVTRTTTVEVTDRAVVGRYSNEATVSATAVDPVMATAIVDLVRPEVLGASTSLAETGVSSGLFILYIALGVVLIGGGILLARKK